MRSLSRTQAGFAGALLDPASPVPGDLRRRAGGAARRRFDVHRNNVVAGIIEGLRSTFPAVDRLVGGAFFDAAARAYLRQDPPRSPLMFRYGGRFADFLDRFSPAASLPYLGDVARLEWARLEAYHASDRDPIGLEALAALPDAGAVTVELHPSLGLVGSRWPVVSLWAASTGRGAVQDVDLRSAEQALIVRPALAVDTHVLPAGGFSFVAALRDGAALSAAAGRAAEAAAEFDLAAHLRGLFDAGAVVAVG